MSDKLELSLNAMKHAVMKWREAADHLATGRDRTPNLEIAANQAGTFGRALAEYEPAPGYFWDRLQEGVVVLNDIATVLEYAHNQYLAEELERQTQFTQLEGEL
ncbi:hypothetical protein ACL02S_08700 [Nocardia sp. 004]|uniref:hypothetical protein n=1 Tax=Nocardia sp. 004 TaxID=3385978 RepID=UPI0039A0DD39